MSENNIFSEAEEEHDTFASNIDVTSTNPGSSRVPARNSSNATLRQSQSNAETSSKVKKRSSKSNVRNSTSKTNTKVGARTSKINNAGSNPRSTVSNTRQTVSGRGTVAGRTTHSLKEEEKIKMSAAARKALMDTESRKRDDENYNPVTDILFGGWGKKAEKEKKEDKDGGEEKSRDSKNKHKKGGVPEPILEEVAEEEKDGDKPTESATGTADPISQQKQASLRRRGSVCLVEKQVVNEESDHVGGLDKPKFTGQRRLSTSTPGLMLRRPTLEADSTSKTKLADLNDTIQNIRKSTSSTTNLMKEQKGRETIITERISKLNLQNNSSGISFGLQRESTAILPDILPLKKNEEKEPKIEEEKSKKSESNENQVPVRFSLNRPPIRRPSISQNIKLNDSTPAIVNTRPTISDRRSVTAKAQQSENSKIGGVKFAPEVKSDRTSPPTTPEPIKVLPGPVFVADSSSNSSFEEPELRYTRNRRQSVVIPDGFNKQNLAKTMERARRQSVVNNQVSSTRLSTMKNRRQSVAIGLQTPSSMKLNPNTPSNTNLNQRRSSFAVAPTAHLDGMHDHTFKGAADRIRRLSCALSPFGGLGAVQADRRQSIRRGSISNNTSPRFSLTPDSLNPASHERRKSINPGAVSMERRKSMRHPSTPGLGVPATSRRKSFINFAKSKENLESLHHDQMTPASEALTNEQIQAFKEAFDLFDNNGGGTIDSAELKETLDSVGIEIDQEDIEDVMMKLDEDGNGEIDFEEFLNLMTNTEMFLEAFARKKNHDGNDANEHGYRDHLLFDALTEFMKKSALKAADEIVGYYAKKYKKVVKTYNMNKGAHVVGHYADGARLIGLTEKQIYSGVGKE